VNFNENKKNKWIKEGRGTGEYDKYISWLKIQDFPSLGRASRILGRKTGRIHHLFSDIQLRYFYLLEWEPCVIDIREYFPLLDFNDVVKQKSDLNLRLFMDKESNTPYVLTTTFLITIKKSNGEIKLVARAVKGASDLNYKKSALEKMEMERRYWKEKGIDFSIVTNKNIPLQRSQNIEWVYSSLYTEQGGGYSQEERDELAQGLFERLHENSSPIRKIAAMFEIDYQLEAGTGILLFKHLIAERKIVVNMDEPINLNSSSSSLTVKNSEHGEGERKDAIHG
jgi:hypothetical protein